MSKRTPKKKVVSAKGEANKYDKITKENLRELSDAAIIGILGYKDYRLEALPKIKLQTTLEKEPDFLMKIYDKRSPKGRILHFEFEGKDEDVMDWRMLEYMGIIGKIYQLEIEQQLFYLGEGVPKNIKGQINHTLVDYRYGLHVLGLVDFKEFLHADKPEAVIFAILANPQGLSSVEIIRLILERLISLTGDSIAIRKFVKQLIMLSRKRNLHSETIKQVNNMIGYNDYEDDILYINGVEKGTKLGIEKGTKLGIEKGTKLGIEKGKELALQEKNITLIRNMLILKLDIPIILKVTEVTLEYFEEVKKQLAKEPDIILLLKKKNADIKKIAKKLSVNPVLVKVIQQHLKK